jgi:hypothetical protein
MRAIVIALLVAALGSSMAWAESAPASAGPVDYSRIHRELQRTPATWAQPAALAKAVQGTQAGVPERRDSVWNGALIGGGIGAAGGYVWAHWICGANDSECFAIAGTVGIIGGAAIGLAAGAIADALHK